MISEELREYIESQRQNGVSDELIKQTLEKNGWAEVAVNEALAPKTTITEAEIIPPQAFSEQGIPKIYTIPPPSLNDTSNPTTDATQSDDSKQSSTEPTEEAENPAEVKQKPKLKKWLKIGIISFLSLIIVAATGWFLWQFFSPDKVIVSALSKLALNESTSYELKAEFTSQPPVGQSISVPFTDSKFTIEASIDEKKPVKGRVLINAVELSNSAGKPSGEAGSLELRWLDSILYIKLATTSKDVASIGISEFIGKWYSVNIQKNLDELNATQHYNTKLTGDETKKLIEAYKKSPFIVIVSSLGSQTIAGQRAKGYQITYNKEKLANWIVEAGKITAQPNTLELKDVLEALVDPTEAGTIKIWVATKTRLPIRLEYALTATAKEYGVIATVTLESVGKPITVEKPSPVTSLDEMIKQWQGDFSGTSAGLSNTRKWLISAYRYRDEGF